MRWTPEASGGYSDAEKQLGPDVSWWCRQPERAELDPPPGSPRFANKGGIPMPKRITPILALTVLFIIAMLFLGTAAPRTSVPMKSPYVSALSNFAVGTAVAASHKCSNSGCLVLQGIQSCRTGEYPGTNCVMVSGNCNVTSCR
jgi:hypothetical protein